MGRVFSKLVRSIVDVSILDTQCGFKMFTAEAVEAIFSLARVDRFAFDVEVLVLARRLGFGVAEVPVSWHEMAGSKVSLATDPWRMLREVYAIRKMHAAVAPRERSKTTVLPLERAARKKAG